MPLAKLRVKIFYKFSKFLTLMKCGGVLRELPVKLYRVYVCVHIASILQ